METRNYPGVEVNMQTLTNQLRELLDNHGYKVLTKKEPSGVVLEAHKSNTVRDWTALSHALTIRVTPEHE